ncbi:hypothetical protein C7I86_11680 [Synechocystis sp. IPPAS B-1465]|nr:hypothetical protein C7I86_11680 [Synechocystis sp. IPPAS B-1465]
MLTRNFAKKRKILAFINRMGQDLRKRKLKSRGTKLLMQEIRPWLMGYFVDCQWAINRLTTKKIPDL